MQGEYVYCEGVKYSLSCLGASMVLSGSMVTGLFTLQVLLISGSKGISSESSDRRPSIQQQSKQIFFVFLILSEDTGRRGSREECPKRVIKLWTFYKKFDKSVFTVKLITSKFYPRVSLDLDSS